MGLANVCGVLNRWGGAYSIRCRDRWFCFTFTLPAAGPAEGAGKEGERQ